MSTPGRKPQRIPHTQARLLHARLQAIQQRYRDEVFTVTIGGSELAFTRTELLLLEEGARLLMKQNEGSEVE